MNNIRNGRHKIRATESRIRDSAHNLDIMKRVNSETLARKSRHDDLYERLDWITPCKFTTQSAHIRGSYDNPRHPPESSEARKSLPFNYILI